jgi:hypothetical protein
MLSVISEIQNDPDKNSYVSPYQYYQEVKQEFHNLEIMKSKLSKMLFRVACIGKGLEGISYKRNEFHEMCERTITHYMIDGNVRHFRSHYDNVLGYVLFSKIDYQYYDFSLNKEKMISSGYDATIALDIFTKYNVIVKNLFPVTDKYLEPLGFLPKSLEEHIDFDNSTNICYLKVRYEDLKETLYVLNRLYKKVTRTDIDYHDQLHAQRSKLEVILANLNDQESKDIEVCRCVKIRKDFGYIKPMIYQKEEPYSDYKLRMQIAKVLQAVGGCQIQGASIVLDVDSRTRSAQMVTIVAMIAIDYYQYRVNVEPSRNVIINNFFYLSNNITKTCYSKLRDIDQKKRFKKARPDLFDQIIEYCRAVFQGFEEFHCYPPEVKRDYVFLE